MNQRTLALVVVGLYMGVVGFLLGSLLGDDEPAPSGSLPTQIATRSSSPRIPTLSSVEQIPTLDLPAETRLETGTETSASAGESEPAAEPEEESSSSSPPSTSSPSPEVTVAPSE